MVDEADLKRRVAALRGNVLGVLWWGSTLAGEETPRSDIDLCVVAGPGKDAEEALRAAWRLVDQRGLDREVDFKVFEALPRFLQGAVLERNSVLLTEDEPSLFEYLYPFRKRWLGEAHRQRVDDDEMRRILQGGG